MGQEYIKNFKACQFHYIERKTIENTVDEEMINITALCFSNVVALENIVPNKMCK